MTTPEPPAAGGPDRYVVIGECLVEDTGTCTCGYGTGGGEPHEQYCGLEPVAKISDIVTWAENRVAPRQPGFAPRLYIAGPMTGIPDYNYPAFRAAAATLRDHGYPVADPSEADGTHLPYGENIRAGLLLLLGCDAVAVLPGWDSSRGAGLEVRVAEMVGMDVRPVEEWVAAATPGSFTATPAPTPARQIQRVTANPGVIDHEHRRTELLAAEWAAEDDKHAIRQIRRVEPPDPEDDDWDPDEDHPR